MFQPSGPYFLCGSYRGCLIAFEMARLLSSEGLTVALLVLLEPEFPAHKKPKAFGKSLDIGGRLKHLFRKSNPIANKILLFLSEELARERDSDPFRWWIDSAASKLELYEVAGRRGSLLREPQVTVVAEKLRDSLHQA
jgi:Thioesterase domain